MTRKMSDTMKCTADELHCVIKSNPTSLNIYGGDMIKKFNRCSAILYYAGMNLKEKSFLGFHSGFVYSPINGEFVTRLNFQVENTPSVIYSIGDSRNLYWKVER